jgi:hypothetical protein
MKAMIAAATLALPMAASATPVTIDFNGTISGYSLFDHSVTAIDLLGTLPDLSIFGSLTVDPTLGPAIAVIDGFGFIQAADSSPAQDFIQGTATWAGGVFTGPISGNPPPTAGDGFVGLIDFPPYPEPIITFWDGLSSVTPTASGDGFVSASHALALKLEGPGLPFPNASTPFTGEGFFTPELFAIPGTRLGGSLSQLSTTFAPDFATQVSSDGYIVDFKLNTVSVRTASVPEPATFALFGIGLIGLLVTRRIGRA